MKIKRSLQRNEVGPPTPAPSPPAPQPAAALMSDSFPLLKTKLFIPQLRPTAMPRPRLMPLILRQSAPLTLVSAPAGFSKTTLLAKWIAALGERETAREDALEGGNLRPLSLSLTPRVATAWLSLDDADNDPRRFLAYLAAAFESAVPGVAADACAFFASPQPVPPPAILTGLINALATLDGRLGLVLDDYHVISAQAVHDAVAFLLEHLPPQLRLIVAIRTDPPLPLARLRARDQLAEIRADDLRFTPDEAAAFLNQGMGLDLAAADLAVLEECTEGWIASIQMAALSMQGRDDVAQFVQAFSGSHRYILDYLTTEVLDRQPPAVQEFLLQTSILERLSGPLCDAVLGINEHLHPPAGAVSANTPSPFAHSSFADSQAILDYLDRANLFIYALDDGRRWYRYHHLFADLLRARLQASRPELAPTLHDRAAEWCEAHRLPGEAIRHAVHAQDFERVSRLADRYAGEMYDRGESATLTAWFEALPEAWCVSSQMIMLPGGQ